MSLLRYFPLWALFSAMLVLPSFTFVSMRVQSSIRAFIQAESLWSKEQKEVVLLLYKFLKSGDKNIFDQYQKKLLIQNADQSARLELQKDSPNFSTVDHFLIGGGSHADDVRGMGHLFHYGRQISYVSQSIAIWEQADQLFSELILLANQTQATWSQGKMTSSQQLQVGAAIDVLDIALTKLEEEFSLTLGLAAREISIFLFWANLIAYTVVFFGIVAVILRLRATRQSLMLESRKYRLLAEGLDKSAIVAVTDQRGSILFANAKFCEISGYSATELIGKDHRILNSGLHPKAFFAQMWSDISQGKTWNQEVCNRRKDGSLYWVDTTVVPVFGESGERQYMAIRFDISRQKAAQLKMIEAEKM